MLPCNYFGALYFTCNLFFFRILLEIGDVLETVEKKQLELEEENRRLKAELEKV